MIMIYFADQSIWNYAYLNRDKYFVRSFMSTISIGSSIDNALIPPENIQEYYLSQDMESFRKQYMAYLDTYYAHLAIMDMMMDVYYNPDLIIITDLNNDFVINIIECIQSYIYMRYGYRCTVVYDIDDLLHTDVKDGFGPQFYPMFYRDKRWYINETMDPQTIIEHMDEIEDMSNNHKY